MWLVEHAAADCNLAEPELAAQHQGLSKFNAPAPEEGTGRDAECLLERPAEVALAQTCESRQVGY
jgi:hypothetical protein